MRDKECAKYIDGVAVHYYYDDRFPVQILDDVHKDYRNKMILNTEASHGEYLNLMLSIMNGQCQNVM